MVASIEGICDDLKINMREARNLYQMAGCTTVVKKGTDGKSLTSVSLRLPLTFPRTGRRDRGKN